jgi:nitrite reductase (NAD(P)H)
LQNGSCTNDESYSILTFDARFNDKGDIELLLPETDDLDAVLGTEKWMVQQAKSEALGLGASGRVEIVGPEGQAAKGAEVNAGLACGTSKLSW